MSYEFKYADLLDDDVFKLVFGRESTKDVMIEFLNQVIPDRRIIDLEFIDKEMHPVERDAKGTVYDMFCKTDDGSRIIVEVQRRKQPFYPERALYYSTFQIQRQVEAGAEYYDFLPVYVVSILDFKMDDDPDANAVRTAYRLYEEASHKLLTDRVTFIFIELPKFTKTVEELDGNILEGMYFCFKNMTELESRPEVLDHQIFTKIFDVTELYNMDQDTRDKVLENMTTERDLRNQMTYAREEGHVEERAKNAKNLRDLGVDPEIIAKATGLTVEEIRNL
ncbi:MAG: Rpn family recombination-promoting nuclease/putative transposase [Bacteroidales bacterium]|nr:Rpn family recombination-promoting nuclease/putative transposase [Bacteroidales bacterium]